VYPERQIYAMVDGKKSLTSAALSDMVNIAIMRTFVRLRQILATHKLLSQRLAELEEKCDRQFRVVFDVLKQLMESPLPGKKPMGFIPAPRSRNQASGA
jgi:hypothetical protein